MFLEVKWHSVLLYLLFINLLFFNIFFMIYMYYHYDFHPLFKKLTLFIFLPLWIVLYLLSYRSARQYLAG